MQKKPDTFIDSLITGCLKNDRRSQLQLYKYFAKSMYNTAYRMVQNTTIAEDVMQDAFLSAFSSLHTFRNEVPFDAWMRRIVINKSLDHIRSKKNIFSEWSDDVAPIASEPENQAEDNWKSDQLDLIKKAVLKLPEGYRIIFTLYYYEGYDHDEIAEILNLSASTSRSQLTRAKQKITKEINTKK